MTNKILNIENVSFAYGAETILSNVNLTVDFNEFIWIVGPNGGGKTTLIKLIVGLLHPQTGSIRVFGRKVIEARSRIGYMPQQVNLDMKFPATVLDVVLMGRTRSGLIPSRFNREDYKLAEDALDSVGLATVPNKLMNELSGGQQRRLLIARALASEPELLILDEPTANLDPQIEKELFDLFRKLNEKLTLILVSHDPDFVVDFVKEVVCINRTVARHPTSGMNPAFISQLYGAKVRVVQHDKQEHGDHDKNGGNDG